MTKIRVRTGRGTGSTEIESDDKGNWAGDEFRRTQSDKKNRTRDNTVSTNRGTSSKKYKDIPEPADRPSTEGITRITGRGTSSRQSKNNGTADLTP